MSVLASFATAGGMILLAIGLFLGLLTFFNRCKERPWIPGIVGITFLLGVLTAAIWISTNS